MTLFIQPLAKPETPLVDQNGRTTLPWTQYLQQLDAIIRLLNADVPPLIGVAVPTNANAAAAGVAVGQLYRGTADPAIVYIRTV